MSAATVTVQCAVAVDQAYTYLVRDGMELAPGDIVAVPLGPREALGCVWDEPAGPVDARKLRPVSARLDVPPLNKRLMEFVDWVARYTLAERGMVLKMVLRAPDVLAAEKPVTGVVWHGEVPERITPARKRVLEHLAEQAVWPKSALADVSGVSPGVVDGLIDAGVLERTDLTMKPVIAQPDPEHASAGLNADQAAAAGKLAERVRTGTFGVALLDGVTGSGKTEVYFEAIAEALRCGRQVLVLLPEIALTQDFLDRFARRFGAPPGEWHSGVSGRAQARVWRGVACGEVRVVAGARSALFLPFADLGLIVVDEEHDPAFKQEDRASYHARDMAVKRGHIGDFAIILSSATPSVESRANADAGRYAHVHLPERFGGAAMPDIGLIDMREGGPERGRFLAPKLVEAIAQACDVGQQSLVFLNRRGYAPLTLCRRCGFRFECPNCTAWLVEHRFRHRLVCHHCGYERPVPPACPNCQATDSLVACGPGVERIAEELAEFFPDQRIAVLSSDLIPGIRAMRALLEEIAAGRVDIVIGTQLVAKGHNFPLMSVVGVVDADVALQSADPRAAERTYQIVSQVVGRAGRDGTPARAFIQTYVPDNPVLQAIVAGDREAFYARELEVRKRAGMPPFGRLGALIVSGRERQGVQAYARALKGAAPRIGEGEILGPAEAPIAMIRGRYRMRLLVRTARHVDLSGLVRGWLAAAPPPTGGIRVQVDIDPVSFL
ncbi:MAG: primosomal protein N' [Rhodobiaceae bacterium]|nr:primosomal protein N' [Rhodobiaceae bacterium]MCC0041175.1 primosomal protein N' [Rhodobiaceae bacterium]